MKKTTLADCLVAGALAAVPMATSTPAQGQPGLTRHLRGNPKVFGHVPSIPALGPSA